MTQTAFATAAFEPIEYASRPPGRAANDNEDLIVDLFAGGGGASEAILKVTGRHPDIACNHDAEAISMHEVNHPSTYHLCEDIRGVDIPAALARFNNRRVGLMWASPDCKDHSKAKGGKPKDSNIRGLAWQVVRWASAIRKATGHLPTVIALENVEEFQDWGPLHKSGELINTVVKDRRGETFKLWVSQLENLGFVVEWRELVAADYGAPTTRKRLFLIARSDGREIRWPRPTHMKREKILALQAKYEADLIAYDAAMAKWSRAQDDLFNPEPRPVPPVRPAALKVWRSAAEIIQWNLEVPSIFGRKNPLKPKTQNRIARGIKRYVIEAQMPFLINVTHTTRPTGYVYPGSSPMPTATTAKGGEFAVSMPYLMPLTHGDARTWSPVDAFRTVTAAPRGEFGMVAPILVPRYGEREGQEPRALDIAGAYPTVVPTGNGGDLGVAFLSRTDMQSAAERNGIHSMYDSVRTITTKGGFAEVQVTMGPLRLPLSIPALGPLTYHGDMALAGFVAQNNGDRIGREFEEPVTTLTHRGTQQTIAGVFMSKMSENGIGYRPDGPLHTAMAGAPRHYVVAAHLDRNFGSAVGGRDIEQPHPAVMTDGAGGKSSLITAHLARQFGKSVGSDMADPAGTVMASGSGKTQLVAPFLTKYYRTGSGLSVGGPADAVTAKDRFNMVSTYIEQANTGMVGRSAEEPVSTIVGKGCTQRVVQARMAEMGAHPGTRRADVLAFLWEHFGEPTEEQWANPLGSDEARLRFGLVVIDGVVWQIVDIGMRMLVPRELYQAQGFAPSYVIDKTSTGKPITKTAQTRMAGNSVSPPPAAALLAVNLPEPMLMKMAA